MKVKVLWQTLKVLLETMKAQYQNSERFNPVSVDSVTDYYFLASREKNEKNPMSTIGWDLQQTFPEQNIAEKSVYNYVYLPASKQRDQFFKLEKRYPAVFFKYIGCSDFSSFLDWCEQEDKLDSAILQEQRALLYQYKDQKNQYYFCYFPINRQIVQAVAIFKNWQTLQLTYLDFQQEEVALKGKVETKKKQLYVALSRDYQVGLKQDRSVTFLSLANSDYTSKQPTLLQGTYAGISIAGHPIAGKIVFEKITETVAKTASPKFINNRYTELLQQNLTVNQPNLFTPVQQGLSGDNRQKQLKKLAGIYKGYISILKNQKDQQPTIVEAISIIRPDGSVDCKGYSNIYYSGHITLFSGGGYAKLTTFTEDRAHQFTYLLELKYTNDNIVHMEGVYVGSFKSKLVNGREYFEKLCEYAVDKEYLMNEKLAEYQWANLLASRPLFARKLQRFFVKKDYLGLLQQLSRPAGNVLKKESITGVFNLFFFSSAKNIRKYVVEIDGTNHKVRLKTNNNPSSEGTFFIADSYLFLKLQPLQIIQEYATQIITFIGNKNEDSTIDSMMGIISGLSDDDQTQRPVSLRCLFVRTTVHFENANTEQIELGSLAFKKLNENDELPDLGYFFSGNHHNFIETFPDRKLQNLKTLKDANIGGTNTHSQAMSMFKAACFTALQIEDCIELARDNAEHELNQLTEEFLSQIKQAKMHGFGYLSAHRAFLEQAKQKSLYRFAQAFSCQHGLLQLDDCKIYRALPILTPTSTL